MIADYDGSWEERETTTNSNDEQDAIRKSFAQFVFDSSLNFNS